MSEFSPSKKLLSLKVIPLELTHIKFCKELDALALNSLWNHQQWHNELANPRIICLGITRGSKLLAFVSAQIVVDELQLSTLAVHPEFQRKGIGRSLLLTLFEKARSKGAVKATLEVSSENIAAKALYKSLGFEIVGSRDGYYSNGSDALIQSCPLKF